MRCLVKAIVNTIGAKPYPWKQAAWIGIDFAAAAGNVNRKMANAARRLMSYGVTGDRELVQMPPNRGGSVLILWGKAPKVRSSRSFIVWMNAPRQGPHHDAQI